MYQIKQTVKYIPSWISIEPFSACFRWICMKFGMRVQLQFVVCIPCHNCCASLLWVKPLWDMPPPHTLINQISLKSKTRTLAERMINVSDQRIFTVQSTTLSCHPPYSKAGLVSYFSSSGRRFLGCLLQVCLGTMNKDFNE